MPKVETSLIRGLNLRTDPKNYVSNLIGNDNFSELVDINFHHLRNRRDVLMNEEIPKPKRRKVIKKLIRIQSLNNTNSNELDTSTESGELDLTTTRKYRRRIKIKKKKRRLLTNLVNSEENSQEQSSKRRRKVVVTKKRLIPLKTQIIDSTKTSPNKPTITSSFFNISINGNREESSINEEESRIIDENFETTPISTSDEIEEEAITESLPKIEDDTVSQNVPDYEPFFPELTESFDAPILLLKTTILSSIELVTKTIVESRLRTFTFIVTRVNGNEQIVTSTTEVKPHTKTSIITEPLTKFTTLTLLDFDATSTLNPIPMTPFPSMESSQLKTVVKDDQGRAFEEARYNLATRVMSNGVEVIVAGDKSTLPGEPDVKRILPSTIYKPVTLKPSTLSDHMMMLLPQDSSNINSLSESLYPNQFVTKTCLTTFTYLTTYLENGSTTVSSHEQVLTNIATEERNTGKILPTPAMGITLTQYPNLSVGVFHTTYTYLNTLIDGEQPIVVSSKHTVTNTVTAPDDYLSLLQPSEKIPAQKDTNTYYSTLSLEKTLYEDEISKVISTNEVVTQVVITESVPPKATSVMTSYIALDIDNPISLENLTTTDVVKTYFVTYTYYNTMLENGSTVVKTNVSTSSDVITEKLYLHPKRTQTTSTSTIKDDKKKQKVDDESFHILATKTYHTTFTYFTTLLQEDNSIKPTVISSHSNIVENIVTETINPTLINEKYLNSIRNEFKKGSNSIEKIVKLRDGQKLEITAILNELKEQIVPTKVQPIEKTQLPNRKEEINLESSNPSVITGSTIIFLDDLPENSNLIATPSLKPETSSVKTTKKNSLSSLLSSEIVTKTSVSSSKLKRNTKTKSNKLRQSTTIKPSKSTSTIVNTTNKLKVPPESTSNNKKKQVSKIDKPLPPPIAPVTDLLGLGSINMNSLQALTPVLNAMAGLIETNLKSNRRNDTTPTTTSTTTITEDDQTFADTQNRSPIYIPVGGLATDIEVAESQNIATFHLQETVDDFQDQFNLDKPTHESPLLNGGIPISPGDVITANSDVIVGKPGRIGPRIPSIPLNQIKEDEVPVGMKPPPLPNKIWPKRNHDYKHIPVGTNLRKEKPSHSNHDDYIGPPPPPSIPQSKDKIRGEKHKHIPLNPPEFHRPYEHVNIPIYAQNQNNYGISYGINEVNHEIKIPNIREEIQKNYELASKNTYPVYAQNQNPLGVQLGVPINDFNIQPSVVNEPIVLPEIIERSTEQPLLVNIQPSQVAFVNIPHNRTTALIYGGSTEPHHFGQYFDDPSPYPEPEFSGIESFNQGIPQFASVYHDTLPNQKQVGGVIKVGTQPINIEPNLQSSEQKVKLNIVPSKPTTQNNDILLGFHNNHEVNVNVPPLSFGMVHQDNEFNAHVINHGDLQFSPPPLSYDIVNKENVKNHHRPNYQPSLSPEQSNPENSVTHFTNNQFIEQKLPQIPAVHLPTTQTINGNHQKLKPRLPPKPIRTRPQIIETKLKFPSKPNYARPKPNTEIVEYMTPPPFQPLRKTNKPNIRPRPQPIPLIPANKPQINELPSTPHHHHHYYHQNHFDQNDEDDDDDDDLTNEDGEVIQESNSRPLRPGQLPFEILKAKTTTSTTTTTERSQIHRNNNTIRFPNDHFPNYVSSNFAGDNRPIISHPRPFVVRPENQQTNQINNFDQNYGSLIKIQPDSNGFVQNYSTIQNSDNFEVITETSNRVSQKFQPGTINGVIYLGEKTTTPIDGHFYYSQKPKDENLNYYHNLQTEKSQINRGTFRPKITTTNKFGKPEIPSYPAISTIKTTQKPSNLVYYETINENHNGKPSNNIYHENRPKVTSLPIDYQTSTVKNLETIGTQTEKPFKSHLDKPLTIQELLNEEIVTSTVTVPVFHPEFNTIPKNISSSSRIESDMEIMKPPPLIPEPDINMQPPSTEKPTNAQMVPNINQTIDGPNTSKYVPKPLEDMVPPPPELISEDDVLGLSPPPLVTTYKPIISHPAITTSPKPVFSLEIDQTTEHPIIPFSSSTNNIERITTRPRKPYTPRPSYASTTTTSKKPFTRRPIVSSNKITTEKSLIENTTTSKAILPSPTIKNVPTMEVIIGKPNINLPTTTTTEDLDEILEVVGSEIGFKDQNQKTLIATSKILQNSTNTFAKLPTSSVKTDILTTPGIHHSGNEVKIVDDTLKQPIPSSTKETKSILPTRYITHTKTSTVTITQTTVVKTLGGPPSTLTLLVTKTEKSTIVDTVTEFHTLVKPTSIIETVTTTIKQNPASLYPSDVYGSTYPSIQIRPTVVTNSPVFPTLTLETEENLDEDLDQFIINETDPPPIPEKNDQDPSDENESIFVVMTDKNKGSVIKVPNNSYETQDRDEMLSQNEVNNVLLGGIFISNQPSLEVPHSIPQNDKCAPECKASRNELCQKVEGMMRCVCRPGFARMFPDRPCIPTYTYSLNIELARFGRENFHYSDILANKNSTEFAKIASITHEALDRMVMQSDLRDIYHGVHIHSYEPSKINNGIKNKFYLQLSDNIDERHLEDVFKKYLRNNNYSLGGTEVYAARESLDNLKAEDFDECTNSRFHDCSENAQCFNLKGTYTCSCKEGFADLSENILYPGRMCSAEMIGCERCNYHGTCYSHGDDQFCECFHWYTGESCHINLKVLLIALVTLGTIFLAILLVCIILTCVKRKPRTTRMTSGITFLPQRVGGHTGNHGTIDRRAMIQDTSSEDSRSENNTLPYVAKKQKILKGALKKTSTQHNLDNNGSIINFPDQKDRSLTVMIPRAKYHPAPPTSPLSNYTTFDARKPSVPSTSNEAKLLSYLDAGPSPSKSEKRKYSNAPSDSYRDDKPNGSRKTSGALISAGFEVSATVLANNMGTIGTTCGTEADRSENATLIQKISADLLSSTGTRSQFNTLRKSLVDDDIDPMANWLDITPRINTVSEARSYDETTIPPPMKSFRNDYGSKPSSQHQNDEANTMAERDLGSTFLLPHTHLYKPDRGSDISGFESL